MPASRSGTRNAPPPTAISGTSPASVFIRSTALLDHLARTRRAPPATIAGGRLRDALRSPISSEAGGDRDIGRGQRVAAEHQRLFGQAIADAARPIRQRVGSTRLPPPSPIDSRSGMRNSVRTPPTSTDRIRLARKAAAQLADIGRRAADIDDHRVLRCRDRKAAPRIELVGPEAKLIDRQRRRRSRPASPCRRSASDRAARDPARRDGLRESRRSSSAPARSARR